jgi:hypothetical protein
VVASQSNPYLPFSPKPIPEAVQIRGLTPNYIKKLAPDGLRKQAEEGDTEAQLQLYWQPDEPERLAWLCQAADQGNPEAQYRLALLYRYGKEGLPQSNTWSYVWYQLAQSNGHWAAAGETGELLKLMSPSETMEGKRMLQTWEPGQCIRLTVPPLDDDH